MRRFIYFQNFRKLFKYDSYYISQSFLTTPQFITVLKKSVHYHQIKSVNQLTYDYFSLIKNLNFKFIIVLGKVLQFLIVISHSNIILSYRGYLCLDNFFYTINILQLNS